MTVTSVPIINASSSLRETINPPPYSSLRRLPFCAQNILLGIISIIPDIENRGISSRPHPEYLCSCGAHDRPAHCLRQINQHKETIWIQIVFTRLVNHPKHVVPRRIHIREHGIDLAQFQRCLVVVVADANSETQIGFLESYVVMIIQLQHPTQPLPHTKSD